jgi:hypothetical protein
MRPVVVGLSLLALFIVMHADRSLAAQRNEIVGAWRSDEARTVEGLRAMGNRLTEAQRKVFLRSGFFGQLIVVYREKDVITVYEGECKAPTPYQIARRDENVLEIRLSEGDKIETQMLRLDGDSYSVPLPAVKDGREFFNRLPVATATKEHPCLRKLLAK